MANATQSTLQLWGLVAKPRYRSVEEAQSECERELGVRDRCFARWVADGKMAKVDALDRLERMRDATYHLAVYSLLPEADRKRLELEYQAATEKAAQSEANGAAWVAAVRMDTSGADNPGF